MDNPDTIPTWGYRPDGAARIFDLARDEGLPDGWSPSPSVITDPALATADVLTVTAEGRVFAPQPVADSSTLRTEGDAADGSDALINSFAEIERLHAIIEAGTAENARLVAEIEAAEGELDAAAQSIVDLQAALVKAQEDGGFAVTERDAANASLEALKDELAKVRSDLDAASAPKATTAAKLAPKAR